MKKHTKKLLTLGMTAGFLASGCMTAFAAYKDAIGNVVTDGWAIEDGKFLYIENGTALTNTWKQDSTVWVYLGEDGKAVTNCWRWIDGNQDGVSECYYFDKDGLMASDTDIEDYTVNADGAWTVDGVVQTKQ